MLSARTPFENELVMVVIAAARCAISGSKGALHSVGPSRLLAIFFFLGVQPFRDQVLRTDVPPPCRLTVHEDRQ
jgi:hypothetical protein